MPHKKDERFREVGLPAPPDVKVTALPGGKGKTVTGTCPRCADTTTFTFRVGTASGGKTKGLAKVLRKSTAPKIATATVYCLCGHLHEGRPDDSDEMGCGAYWEVTL